MGMNTRETGDKEWSCQAEAQSAETWYDPRTWYEEQYENARVLSSKYGLC